MKKNVVQDIIPAGKSIRNVKLASRSRTTEEVKKEDSFTTPISINKPNSKPIDKPISQDAPIKIEPTNIINTSVPNTNNINRTIPPVTSPSQYKYEYSEPKKPRRKILYVALGIFLIALAFGISAFFKSAKISITPKQDTETLNGTFLAKKDMTTNGLGFQIVTTTKDVQKTVDATGQQQVDTKAQGKIIIYNNYSSQSQKLVATTRFETPEGLIFRLISAVTVPGRQTVSGKTVAGSIEATVVADKSGEAYNIGLKDFTVPGLKGDPKYSQIYGRSKTEMSGGYSGMQKIVSKDVLDQANKDMETMLTDSLSKDIVSQIPADFILYPSSLSYKFEPATQVSSSAGGAVLSKKGTASGIIFDKGALSRTIIAKVLPTATNDVVKITNLDALDFSLQTPNSFDPSSSTQVNFSLKGDVKLVWVFDENKIKSDLLGLSKKNATQVIATYPSIKEAWVETQPFWNQTIPLDPKKVTIINTAGN